MPSKRTQVARNVKLQLSLLAIACALSGQPLYAQDAVNNSPIVLELFTSEGCSSCPPADILLEKLQLSGVNGQRVIAISEHVDYWNYLGWKDKFSSQTFSQRQQEYSSRFRQTSSYTPEVVIDGAFGTNGADVHAIESFARQSASNQKVSVTIKLSTGLDVRKTGKVEVIIQAPKSYSGDKAHVFLVVTEGNLSSPVKSGENGGKLLRHTAVARSLSVLERDLQIKASATVIRLSGDITLAPTWKTQELRIVALVQRADNGRIIGAQEVKVSP